MMSMFCTAIGLATRRVRTRIHEPLHECFASFTELFDAAPIRLDIPFGIEPIFDSVGYHAQDELLLQVQCDFSSTGALCSSKLKALPTRYRNTDFLIYGLLADLSYLTV